MVRVAVIGTDATDWNVLAARVRHACVERWEGCGVREWGTAEAVAFVGDYRLDLKHEEIESALAGGRHVLLATRWTPEISQLERWFDLAQTHRVRLDVVNPQLARPSRRLIRQQIENGKLGEVGLVRISRTVFLEPAGFGAHTPPPITAPVLADVDLAMWLIGRAPNRVFAIRRRIATAGLQAGECLHVHLGFDNGSSALLMAASVASLGEESESLSVIARSGAAYADDHQNRQLLLSGGAATAPRADEGEAVAVLLDEFAVRVRGEFDPVVELRRRRQLSPIAATVQRSAEMQQALALELD